MRPQGKLTNAMCFVRLGRLCVLYPGFGSSSDVYWTQIGPKFDHLPDHLPNLRVESRGAWAEQGENCLRRVLALLNYMEMLRHKYESLLRRKATLSTQFSNEQPARQVTEQSEYEPQAARLYSPGLDRGTLLVSNTDPRRRRAGEQVFSLDSSVAV